MKHKTLLFIPVMLFMCFGAFAQEKIGYVDIKEILNQLPERKQAQLELERYVDELGNDFQAMKFQYDQKIEEYTHLPENASAAVKENMESQIMQMDERMNNFQRQSQELLDDKELALLTPINDMVMATIEKVAKKNGYVHVFDTGTTLVYPKETEFTRLVLKEFGL